MAFFFLTNDFESAHNVENQWVTLFDNAQVDQFGKGFYLTTTRGFRVRELDGQVKVGEDSVRGFGSYFTQDGFGIDSAKKLNLLEFDQEISGNIFGHYIFLICKSEKVRVVTDPVGLMNVFWSQEGDNIFVSNDITAVAKIRKRTTLSPRGVQEFLLKESTLGKDTIFREIRRLGFANELEIANDGFEEKVCYTFEPEKLSFEGYIDRINNYFGLISKYKSRIAADLSAGFDSRLIAICARASSLDFKTLTNSNLFDAGVDKETVPYLANALGVPFQIIGREKNAHSEDGALLLHGLTLGRSVLRSKSMLMLNSKKYKEADLILGGYGGEILRGKYCKYANSKDFLERFYGVQHLDNWGSKETKEYLYKNFPQAYHEDWFASSKVHSNWLYSMDRMRIWGSSELVGKLLYGDRIHPFMDWYLMEPIFSWDFKEIEGNKLIVKIMEHFSPEATSIPINEVNSALLKRKIEQPESILTKLLALFLKKDVLIDKVKFKLRIGTKSKVKSFYKSYERSSFDEDFLRSVDVDLEALEKFNDSDAISRLASIKLGWEYIKDTPTKPKATQQARAKSDDSPA